MSKESLHSDKLKCPISLDWFVDPICLPCCGQAISRASLVDWFLKSKPASDSCPLCRKDLSQFDVANAPRCAAINDMAEQESKAFNSLESLFEPNPHPENSHGWKAKLDCLSSDMYRTKLGRLTISSEQGQYNSIKTLLIPVIDKSGSMEIAIAQVKYSLHRIVELTYDNPQIMTSYIMYNDAAKSTEINKANHSQVHYKTEIDRIVANGGTSFRVAFNEIISLCDKHKNSKEIGSIVVIFLTDGEDSTASKGNDRVKLVQELKTKITSVWTKPFTVHTVGFTASHDFAFLNSLSEIGTHSGAYRFSDPTEDTDSLSSKINSLLHVIASSSFHVPLKIMPTDYSPPIIQTQIKDSLTYWVNLTEYDWHTAAAPIRFKLSIDDSGNTFDVIAEIAEDENDPKIWQDWYSNLIDDIAAEILLLSKIGASSATEESKSNAQVMTLDQQIHCEILEQRSRAIQAKLVDTSCANAVRLESLIESLKTIKAGGKVNQSKLTDLKFEGKYATTSSGNQIGHVKSVNKTADMVPRESALATVSRLWNRKDWTTMAEPYPRRCNAKKDANLVFQTIANGKNQEACQWVRDHGTECMETLDEHGSNALMVAASIGRELLVREILNVIPPNGIFARNQVGYNALDLCIYYGYWRTYDLLLAKEAVPTIEPEILLQTCLSKPRPHFNLASRIIKQFPKHRFQIVSETLLKTAPTSEVVEWLSFHSQKEISLEIAIEKGMYDIVKEIIEKKHSMSEEKGKQDIGRPATKVSFAPFLKVLGESCRSVHSNHYKIVKLLLERQLADANEIIEFQDENGDKEIMWLFFMACGKNLTDLFELLLQYSPPLNQQNRRGTTALWIASCNRNIDIVARLLQLGASPNIANFKGDGPIIPAAQKAQISIVQLLLDAGCDLNLYNRNRDNVFLICSRSGQAEILSLLFQRLDTTNLNRILNFYAEIDGFVPLLAATELDKIDCIRVCVKYGADLETKTADNNPVLAGGTALHLAAHYGRVLALQTLCELGANVLGQTNVDGLTPLHIAIKQSQSPIVRFLLKNTEKGKQCLIMEDKFGRRPEYYARMSGNEAILEEFFTNRLSIALQSIFKSNPETEKKCAQVLTQYGQSIGCYESTEIVNLRVEQGSSILTEALVHGNYHLIQCLKTLGASYDQPDDYQITPLFWATYLNYPAFCLPDHLGAIVIQNVHDMIERVKTIGQSSAQNKLLTNLSVPSYALLLTTNGQEGKPLTVSEDVFQSPLYKMNYGFNMEIDSKVVDRLVEANHRSHSLLGFIEKLKSNSVFPQGKAHLEQLIWKSKIHLIRMIASGESVLAPIHLLALYLYTGNLTVHNQVNLSLSTWNNDEKQVMIRSSQHGSVKDNSGVWNPFIFCLYQAIMLLPPFVGEVYRAVDAVFDIDVYKIGNQMQWNTFTICSLGWNTASEMIQRKTGIVFVIQCKSGRSISKYSKTPADSEVILVPGTTFRVLNYYKPNVIALGQANIRQTTFQIEEKDLEKARKGYACIIIELQEI